MNTQDSINYVESDLVISLKVGNAKTIPDTDDIKDVIQKALVNAYPGHYLKCTVETEKNSSFTILSSPRARMSLYVLRHKRTGVEYYCTGVYKNLWYMLKQMLVRHVTRDSHKRRSKTEALIQKHNLTNIPSPGSYGTVKEFGEAKKFYASKLTIDYLKTEWVIEKLGDDFSRHEAEKIIGKAIKEDEAVERVLNVKSSISR